jgi:hypothetical protein
MTLRVGARPSTRSTTKMAHFTILGGVYFAAETRSTASQPIAAPEELGNYGRVKWISGRLGEVPAYSGTDFLIARDGRIADVIMFFDKPPELNSAV